MENIINKWDEIISFMRDEYELSPVSVEIWLDPLRVVRLENDTLYIVSEGTNQIGIDYLYKKYYQFLQTAIGEITGKKYEIVFLLQEDASAANPTEEENSFSNDTSPTPSNYANYTFESFVVGSNNRFAHMAALAVAESPGEVYNPLYIYGSSGLGKTHLMYSIVHFVEQNNPSAVVRYISSEKFTNEVIDAIGNKNNFSRTEFKNKYRNVDILLVDDIQFIIGKEATQEEFFNIFNELYESKKQIVISSDMHPKNMQGLVDRLRTRLEWGLIADINLPDYETRMAILKKKTEANNLTLSDDILHYIATNITSNIRELEGCIIKLRAYYNLYNTPITYDIAVNELQSIITPNLPTKLTMDHVIKMVCEHFGITEEEIKSSKKNANIAYPRQIAMYICYHYVEDITYKSIGAALGNRDHTTIMHGIKVINKDLSTKQETKLNVETLIKKINAY